MNQGKVEAKTSKGDNGGIRLGGAWFNCNEITAPFVKALNYGDEVVWEAEGKTLTYIHRLKTSQYARPAQAQPPGQLSGPEILACMKVAARLCEPKTTGDYGRKLQEVLDIFRKLRG
jgi:hypothetical protein